MIPDLVPRRQLLAANGLFTLTLNAAFALGFALLGPLVVTLAGPNALILLVAGLLSVRRSAVRDPAFGEAGTPGRPVAAPGPRRGGAGRGLHVEPAARGPVVHPRPPQHQLVADLPRHHGVADRRAGRAGAGLRNRRPGPRAEGFRGCRAAPGHRDRDRHPRPQRLRPDAAAAARDRGRTGRIRDPSRGDRPVGRRIVESSRRASTRHRRPWTCRRSSRCCRS